MNKICKTGLKNYYGEVEIVEKDGKYYMALENYDSLYGMEIPEALASMIITECGDGKKQIDLLGYGLKE